MRARNELRNMERGMGNSIGSGIPARILAGAEEKIVKSWAKICESLAWAATVLALGIGGAGAYAQERGEAADSAESVLEQTTDRVLKVIEEARSYVDENPERYYSAVHEVLDPVIDFRGFARSVMGDYATRERYQSLDKDGQDQLREQLERFSETIRVGLIKTYSKGLLAFGGSRVELDRSGANEVSSKRATLRQLIYSESASPYVVVYQMARDSSGRWRMRNLVVENVNLGQIYRSQFESAARRYKGDLDKVIDNWSTEAA